MSALAEILRLQGIIATQRAEIDRLRLLTDAPIVYKNSDNSLLVEWPSDDSKSCLMSRDLFENIVAELNATRSLFPPD